MILKRTVGRLGVHVARHVTVLVVVGAGGLVVGCGSGQSTPTRPTPPRPRLSTRGVERQASLVSYCWSVPRSDGSRVGSCADGAPGPTTHRLRWTPGVPIVLDLVLPAHDVQVRIATNSRPAQRLRQVDLHKGSLARRWSFKLTPADHAAASIQIAAQYAQGDLLADMSLTEH